MRDLQGLVHRLGIAAAVAMGDYILRHFYGGDYAAFCNRDPHKERSFRALCVRRDLPVSAATLRTAVHVAAQVGDLPEVVTTRLSVAHLRALIPVKEPTVRRDLATQAVAEGWTSSRMEREARRHLPVSRAGRKPLPPIVREVTRLSRVASAVALESRGGFATPTDRDRVREALEDLDAALATLTQARERLEAVVADPATPEPSGTPRRR